MDIISLNRYGSLLGIIGLFLLSSCCECIDIGCNTQFAELVFEAQVGLQADFRAEDLEEVYVIRVNAQYQRLDSAGYRFAPEAPGSDIYNIFVTEGVFGLEESETLKDYNYLIVNPKTLQIDTLSNMSYARIESVESCENCSGLFCQSDDLVRVEYQDFQAEFSGTLYRELRIPYFRK